jgi:hypothetical protein
VNVHDRKEQQVRALLEGPHQVVPVDLAARAAERGRRILRTRRTVHTALWLLLLAALVTAVVLAVTAWPDPTPLQTTPTVGF